MRTAHPSGLVGWQRLLVPASLFGSYLLNDGEELLTMARTGELPQRRVNVAIGMMGVLLAAACADGFRTRGRGTLYQDVQLVFGAHGCFHLLASLATGGYTTGVATSPLVLTQGWWALTRLRRAGVPRSARGLRALVIMLGWLAVSHAAGALAAKHPGDVSYWGHH